MYSLEKKFIKTGIYSFIIGLLTGLVWVKDEYRVVQDIGVYVPIAKPMKQYVLEVLRFAAIVTLASLAIQTVVQLAARRQPDDSFSFTRGFVKSFIIVFALIVIAVPLLKLITSFI
ncbi:hypothetical protein [Paenibacillus xylaniclasticus]|uniref:hypothetical protein n=1 Tax=Paenibacillus xylaniclasticus TaxID=588083 RepID=UPI000FDAF771|nr:MULTISPECIES: hypothetical protein [Paenibacillus]GFN30274.1 hypothetical protein PCURB6_05340 [Paenibacillus curdlanolyticus]